MKLRLSILLLAAALAAPAAGQTIKSLGYNTTNGQIVYSGTNDLRFPATIRIGTNQSGLVSGGQFLTFTDGAGGVAMIISTNETTFYDPIAFSSTANASTTRTNLALGATNNVTFSNITADGILTANDSTATPATNAASAQGIQWSGLGGSQHAAIYGGYPGAAQIALAVGASSNALSDVATFRSTGMTVSSNAIVGGTLAVTGNVTMSGVGNTAPSQTADSASSLMTRALSDDRYLGEMWNASRMAAYNTTNPPVTLFKSEPMVTYTNGQLAGPYMHQFIDAEKFAGKTVRVLAYCRVDSTNGGNVQGLGRIQYLTNTAGGPDPNFPLSPGGATHGTIGTFTNVNTDVFPVATSTNQYLIFTSNIGTIPTNAKMIIASFGFNRAVTNTTYTNNLYMHAVQVVVE